MDIVQCSDVPVGPVKFVKDYDRSLMTQDLPRATPTLAHPTTKNFTPMAWKRLEKQEMPEVEGSKARTHYPDVQASRLRDLSLTASDIDYAQPKKGGANSEGRSRIDGKVDPLRPMYAMSSSLADAAPLAPRTSGKCTLDVSDIEFAAPKPQIHHLREYRDPLLCEGEFRSKHWRQQRAAASATPRTPKTPKNRADEVERRCTNPLDPTYRVHVSAASTSLHVRWAEERMAEGTALPKTQAEEIGTVGGARPRTNIHDNGEPQLNLETGDIHGASMMARVGRLPYSIYGPAGVRAQSTSLQTSDIPGAQADTVPRGPRSSCRSARATGASILGVPAVGDASVEARSARDSRRTLPAERGV